MEGTFGEVRSQIGTGDLIVETLSKQSCIQKVALLLLLASPFKAFFLIPRLKAVANIDHLCCALDSCWVKSKVLTFRFIPFHIAWFGGIWV